jgi:hypothetical protein
VPEQIHPYYAMDLVSIGTSALDPGRPATAAPPARAPETKRGKERRATLTRDYRLLCFSHGTAMRRAAGNGKGGGSRLKQETGRNQDAQHPPW